MLLQAIICKMNIVIRVFQVIWVWWGSHVAMLVEVDIELWSNEHPDSDIEFSLVIKQRLFNVFLRNPISVGSFVAQKCSNIFKFSKNFNPSSYNKQIFFEFYCNLLPWLRLAGLTNQILSWQCFAGIDSFWKSCFEMSLNLAINWIYSESSAPATRTKLVGIVSKTL